jgi:LacI family transcriptional regulator
MIDRGHRRIGHVTGPKGLTSVDFRLAGYRQALLDAGIPFDEALVKLGTYYNALDHGARALAELMLLADPPTGVVTTSDALALAIYSAARDIGLRVPEDISVTGFDDLPYAEFLSPPLTTVRQPTVELGRLAVRALVARNKLPERIGTLPIQLIERGSVSLIPAEKGPRKPTRRSRRAS